MTHHNYLPERERWHLFNHLSKINLWTQKHLSLFANSVFLLSPKMVYGLANQITAFIPKIEDDATLANLLTAFGGLGDAAIALILGRANNLAEKLLHKLNTITLPPYLMFFQLTYKFLRVIIKYTEDQEEQPVLAIISTLMSLGCTEQAAIFLDIFKEIKYQLQL